jgi:hypothetical protein
MNSNLTKIKEAFSMYQEGQKLIEQADRKLSPGPATYYIGRVEEYCTALFDRFAPFQEGDEVVLLATPDCSGGWERCRHFLCEGSLGVVHSVDYTSGLFRAEVEFYNESWIDNDGNEHITKEKDRHTFSLSENYIDTIVTK